MARSGDASPYAPKARGGHAGVRRGGGDRDETIGPNKPLRDLAHGLAAVGIASLRYDKRAFAFPAKADLSQITLDEEVIDDAVAAVELLRRQRGIHPGRAYLAGHSLGAMLAPRIAKLGYVKGEEREAGCMIGN